MQPAPKIHVNLVQPAVPDYRVPFMKEFASRAGVELAIWAPVSTDLSDSWSALEVSGIAFRSSPVREIGPFRFQDGSIRAALSGDVLILSLNIRFIDLLPAVIIGRVRRSGIIFWGHGRSPRRKSWATKIRDRIAGLGHVYVLYNKTEADAIRVDRRFRGEVMVAQNTIDSAAVRDAKESALPYDDRRDRVAFVSRLYSAKKVDLLIRAAKSASQKLRRPVELAIVGDGPERKALEALVDELGMASQVTFHGAVHDEAELSRVLQTCCVICLPEAAGLSVVHGMAHGLPVLLNDDYRSNGPEYEIIKPGVNGAVFARGSEESLAEKICMFVSDRALQNRLAEGAVSSITDGGYDVQSMADAFCAAVSAGIASARGTNPARRPDRM